jgi:Fe2+ or Zn2+ uptake regulation protein
MRSVHATPDEIYKAINRADPRASRATVYNSLYALARAGVARGVAAHGKAVRFDATRGSICLLSAGARSWVRESSGTTRWCS